MNEKRDFIPSNLNLYLREIGKFPVLSREEEIRYFKRIQENDEEARNFVIQCNLKLVVNIAKQYSPYKVSIMDLIQEGNLGLLRAIQKFDYTLGFKFSTYASQWIHQYITRFIQEKSSVIHLPAHIAEKKNRIRKVSEKLTKELQRSPTIEEIAEKSNLKVSLVKELLLHQSKVVSFDIPIDDGETCLLDMIIDMNSLSPPRQLEKNLLKESVLASLNQLTEREKDIVIKRYGLFEQKEQTLEEVGNCYNISRERVRQIENKALRKLAMGENKKILKSFYFEEEEN